MIKPMTLLAASAAAAVAFIAFTSLTLAEPLPPGPTPVPPDHSVRALVVYPFTGGPYIKEEQAMDAADRLAEAPITRRAVGFLSYQEAVEWIGHGVGTIDPKRRVYLVVNQAVFIGRRGAEDVVCSWYFAIVDATDGKVRSLGCTDRSSVWPNLPPNVREKPEKPH